MILVFPGPMLGPSSKMKCTTPQDGLCRYLITTITGNSQVESHLPSKAHRTAVGEEYLPASAALAWHNLRTTSQYQKHNVAPVSYKTISKCGGRFPKTNDGGEGVPWIFWQMKSWKPSKCWHFVYIYISYDIFIYIYIIWYTYIYNYLHIYIYTYLYIIM